MSVVGFDFGTQNCVIAAAQKGGIDVLLNEVSARQTPCMVAFGEKQRCIGDSANTQYQRNIRNTVTHVKRIMGHKYGEQDLQEELRYLHYKTFENENHDVGIEVMHCNEKKQFTPVQVAAMVLQHLKETAEKALQRPCKDVVISVPGYWTVHQRRALLDAAQISGLNCMRVFNDHTAAALQYGIYKTNLSESEPVRVMFVDLGYANTTVSIVEFLKGRLKVVGVVYDRHLGGRNFDQVLVEHFVKEFKDKYKLDIKSNDRALIRLELACEKLKKVLNTNLEAPINVDSIMNDIDVKGMMKRPDFEALCKPLLERLVVVVKRAFEDSGVTVDKVGSIELTGGASRLLCVQNKLADFFQKDLSRTLNPEEAVAKGCALQCAMLSPIFKVREFQVADLTPYPLKISWSKPSDAATPEDSSEVFTNNNILPCSKRITFYRKEPFELVAEYSQSQLLPPGTSVFIARSSVPAIPHVKEETPKITVKVKLNGDGLLQFEDAQLVESVEEQEPTPPVSADSVSVVEKKEEQNVSTEPGNVSGSGTNHMKDDKEKKEENQLPTPTTPSPLEDKPADDKLKLKKKVRRLDLELKEIHKVGLLPKEIQELTEDEARMAAADKLAIETADRKNAVETFVYDMRAKMASSLAPFATEKDANAFVKLLDETENWLYGEGEDVSKSAYIKKLEELQVLGEPILKRKLESDNRYEVLGQLKSTIEQFRSAAASQDPKYDHIAQEEKNKVVEECNTTELYINQLLAKQEQLAKYIDPILACSDIRKKKTDLERACTVILNKPKPKVEPKAEIKQEEKKDEKPKDPEVPNKGDSTFSEPQSDVQMEDATPPSSNPTAQTKPETPMDLD